ncbi:hypothetical protein JBE04_08390 [Streptomyces sp. PRKS01-29]|nr:hypothetical protein [Streptomyces sabulosicollis]MBI0294500.1 hypothetical protein [Streptomyces sabulosicollis]
MALLPLATVADLTARGLTVESTETAIVGVYLDVASAAVRDAAGSPISQTTSTITLEGEPDPRLRLPGLPVTAVSTVEVDGEPVTDWRLRSGALWRACGWSSGCEPSEVDVTYTHGLPVVPADIVDLVCRIAAAALVAYRSEAGGTGLAAQDVRAERIGDYSVTYGDDGRITEMELPDYLRRRLAARFGGGAAVVRSR